MSAFYNAPNDYRNYLCHYGVKGMRWKQRKRFSGRDPANQYKTNIPRKASNDEEDSRRVPYRRIPSNIANEINERIDDIANVYRKPTESKGIHERASNSAYAVNFRKKKDERKGSFAKKKISRRGGHLSVN